MADRRSVGVVFAAVVSVRVAIIVDCIASLDRIRDPLLHDVEVIVGREVRGEEAGVRLRERFGVPAGVVVELVLLRAALLRHVERQLGSAPGELEVVLPVLLAVAVEDLPEPFDHLAVLVAADVLRD